MPALTPEGRAYEQGRAEEANRNASAIAAIRRARAVLVQLETSRTSEDIERARHGAMYEIEYAMRIMGVPYEPTPQEEAQARIARFDPAATRVGPYTLDDLQKFDFTEEQRRRLWENRPVIHPEPPPGARVRGRHADQIIIDDVISDECHPPDGGPCTCGAE